MLKVKVPIIFFGTQGFSARRDGRYFICKFTLSMLPLGALFMRLLKIHEINIDIQSATDHMNDWVPILFWLNVYFSTMRWQ